MDAARANARVEATNAEINATRSSAAAAISESRMAFKPAQRPVGGSGKVLPTVGFAFLAGSRLGARPRSCAPRLNFSSLQPDMFQKLGAMEEMLEFRASSRPFPKEKVAAALAASTMP